MLFGKRSSSTTLQQKAILINFSSKSAIQKFYSRNYSSDEITKIACERVDKMLRAVCRSPTNNNLCKFPYIW